MTSLVALSIATAVVVLGCVHARHRGRAAGVVVLALLAAVLTSPAPAPAEPVDPSQSMGARDAIAQARATGQQVEVTDLASPTTRVMADPKTGDLLTEVTAQVSRVKSDRGAWVDASSTLVAAANGSWRTKATPVGITVGGPASRLFEFANEGGTVALSWPAALPSPVVDGSSATYREVLPGVDLVVRAQISGVGTYLVVKDAAAAANPALEKIPFGFTVSGAKTAPHERGLAFTSASGEAKFKLAEPYMWDSRGKADVARSADPAVTGMEARVAPMAMKVTGQILEITPDMNLLRAPDTQFPVIIDPYVHDDPTYVVRVFSGTYSPHRNQWDEDAKIGYNGWTTPYYKSRMYYNFTLPSLTVSDVSSAHFYAKQIHSPQHDCDDTNFGPAVTAGVTSQASSSTTWSSQPSWKANTVNHDYAVGHEDHCGGSYVQKFNLTTAIKTAWASNPKIGVGMKSSSEGDKNGWRHYDQVEGTSTRNPVDGTITSTWYPRIVINYQPTPQVPTGIVISNANAVAGGWATSDSTPSLKAKLTTPSNFPCGSTTTNCLVAEWLLPASTTWVASGGVTTGTTANLNWPTAQPALVDGVPVVVQVRARNTTNGKYSTPVTVTVKHDALPASPTTSVVDAKDDYPLETDVAVDVSSDPDVVQICWTSSPQSTYQGCQPVSAGAGRITLKQNDAPEHVMTYTSFYLVAVDGSGMRSAPTTVHLMFTTAP